MVWSSMFRFDLDVFSMFLLNSLKFKIKRNITKFIKDNELNINITLNKIIWIESKEFCLLFCLFIDRYKGRIVLIDKSL